MKNFFNLVGDVIPNSDEIHLEACEMREIWKEYKEDHIVFFHRNESDLLSYATFLRLWSLAFDHVKVRQYKQVTGKCDTCAKLTALRRSRRDHYGRGLCTTFHALHRSMYIGEREEYYHRRFLAIMHPDKYMSINMDGMDQQHSRLPWMAKLTEFKRPLKQSIEGVLEHGKEFVLYRTFHNVKKGANLAVHCLSLQIEKRLKENGGNYHLLIPL